MYQGVVGTTPDGVYGPTFTRALHVIWILDCSGSMSGEKIQMVNKAIRETLPALKKVGQQNEVRILARAIRFAGNASWHLGNVPTPIDAIVWKDLDIEGGGTSFTSALKLLLPELQLDRIGKRNVPPFILMVSDGECTDDDKVYEKAIEELNSIPWGKRAVRLSIGIGEEYQKEQMDAFITPYLRDQGIETIPARQVNDIYRLIKIASEQATRSSSKVEGQGDAKGPIVPVHLNMQQLGLAKDPGDVEIDFSNIGDSEVM